MKNGRVFFSILLIYSLNQISLFAMQQPAKHFDFLMIIENGSNEFQGFKEGIPPAVFSSMMDGFKQKIPMIVHVGLMGMLVAAAKDTSIPSDEFIKLKKEKLQKELKDLLEDARANWDVRINSAGDWVVIKPKSGENLASLGINESNLSEFWIRSESIINEMEKGSFKPISIDNFKMLFNQSSPIRKRIMAIGHGSSGLFKDPLMLGIPREQYVELLKFLNPSTDFLYVFSCYSGGINSVQFHEQMKKANTEAFSLVSIKFPIVLSALYEAITDVSRRRSPDYRAFFSHLDEYLRTLSTKSLKDALNAIYAAIGIDSGIPLIRFPGANDFFRAVDIDNTVKLLTMVSMRAHMLSVQDKKVAAKISPIEILNNEKLLVYPALVMVPLHIIGVSYKIISMIPGNASHVLDQVVCDNQFDDFLKGFETDDISLKCFLIKKLSCKDVSFERAFLATSKEQYLFMGKVVDSPDYPQYKGSYIKVTGKIFTYTLLNPFTQKDSGLTQVTAISVQELINKVLNTKKTDPEALRHATAGMQTISMLDDAIRDFVSNIK
jgi:hypothetical protein